MAKVFDVAAYIIEKCGPMTHMKLQKLVYYCQAWSLVWDEEALFKERMEAWANGPVVPALYARLRQTFKVSRDMLGNADPGKLNRVQTETVDTVLDYYAKHSSHYLSDLTHMEDPWRKARTGMAPGDRGNQEISLPDLHEYYDSL